MARRIKDFTIRLYSAYIFMYTIEDGVRTMRLTVRMYSIFANF